VVWPQGPVRAGTDTPAEVYRRRGGSAANVAVMVSRAGGSARFLGQVGADALGDRLLDELRADGVDARVRRGGHTGTIVVLVAPDGERTFCTDRGASILLDGVDAGWLAGVASLHVPGYSFTEGPLATSAARLVELAHDRGIAVSLDASSAGALRDLGPGRFAELVERLAPDSVFANDDEAALLDWGPDRPAPGATWTIVRHGAAPTLIVGADGSSRAVPVPVVDRVVDTTGAGDAFAAGFLLARRGGADPIAATEAGHRLATRVLTRPGADLAPDPGPPSGPTAPPVR